MFIGNTEYRSIQKRTIVSKCQSETLNQKVLDNKYKTRVVKPQQLLMTNGLLLSFFLCFTIHCGFIDISSLVVVVEI